MKIFGYDINFGATNNATETNSNSNDFVSGSTTDIYRHQVKIPQTLTRTTQDIGKWRSALNSAENVIYPNRTELYRIYKDIMLDAHLSSIIETRKNAILGAKFIVTKSGKVKEEKTDLIQRKYFIDFCSLAMDSIFYGHSLIQFGDFKNDEFADVTLVPRQYVKPEFNCVVSNPSQINGQSYLEEPFNKWCLGVGDKLNLGLLAKAAPLVIWKKNAFSSWAEYIEKFGVPYRIFKTDTRDSVTYQNAVSMLSQMGSSLYAVLDKEDEFELVEAGKSSASEIFENLINMANSEMSKLILGQTSSTDQKSYVGAAEVHERIMHQIFEADQVFIENLFNYQLVPFLNLHGLDFNNLKIEVEADNELSLIEKSVIDIALLQFYDMPPEYILKTYGTPVIPRVEIPKVDKTEPTDIKNKLDFYYGTDTGTD